MTNNDFVLQVIISEGPSQDLNRNPDITVNKGILERLVFCMFKGLGSVDKTISLSLLRKTLTLYQKPFFEC